MSFPSNYVETCLGDCNVGDKILWYGNKVVGGTYIILEKIPDGDGFSRYKFDSEGNVLLDMYYADSTPALIDGNSIPWNITEKDVAESEAALLQLCTEEPIKIVDAYRWEVDEHGDLHYSGDPEENYILHDGYEISGSVEPENWDSLLKLINLGQNWNT